MGIEGFRAFIKSRAPGAISTIMMVEFKGTRIAIDANLFMYMMMSGANVQSWQKIDLKTDPGATPDMLELTVYWIKMMLDRIINLCSYGITPVFVFDGTNKPKKAPVQESRRKEKQKSKEEATLVKDKLEAILPHERSDEDIKILRSKKQNIVYVNEDQINLFKNFLRVAGVPIIIADGDGEELCCTLAHLGKVSAVYSKDADCAIFGAPITITGVTKGSKPPTQTFDVFLYDKLSSELSISREKLIDMCILHGCDYSPGVRGYGLITAYKKIVEYGCIENIPGIDLKGIDVNETRDSFRIKGLSECLSPVHEGILPSLNINKDALLQHGARPFFQSYSLGNLIFPLLSSYENLTVITDRGAEYILPNGRIIPTVSGNIIVKRPVSYSTPDKNKHDYSTLEVVDPVKSMIHFE